MNEIFAYQFIILLVALILILRSLFKTLSGKKSWREFVLSLLIWSAFAALALFPNVTNGIAHLFGFEVGINLILTITTILLFVAIVMLIVKTDKNASDLTKLVRQIALKDLRNDKSETSQ